MEFSVQLSCDYPDSAYGGERLYKDMLEQAMLADRLGFESVAINAHHLFNLLMMPAPLPGAPKKIEAVGAVEARKKQVVDTPADVFMSVFWTYARTEMGPWLKEIECPCLVLTGELDGGCNPRLNRFMANERADAELIILDGPKHSVLIEGPERVSPHVKDFLFRHNNR